MLRRNRKRRGQRQIRQAAPRAVAPSSHHHDTTVTDKGYAGLFGAGAGFGGLGGGGRYRLGGAGGSTSAGAAGIRFNPCLTSRSLNAANSLPFSVRHASARRFSVAHD